MVLAGCTTTNRLGQFTAASSHNIRNLEYSLNNQTEAHTKGESCYTKVLWWTLGHTDDRLQRAMDDAIKKGREKIKDGDLLVNVRISLTENSFGFRTNCYEVEGDLVSITKK